MKHTIGPWVYGFEKETGGMNNEGIGIVDSPRGIICKTEESSVEETIANARLIAAAPDLLNACKFVLEYYGDKQNAQTRELLERTIAKAEGVETTDEEGPEPDPNDESNDERREALITLYKELK